MQYFKHQSNMRHDIKLKRVIAKYGIEGYGLYNLILESITGSLSTDSPIPDLSETCEDIAEFYNGNTSKINEMANYMINQGLFDLDEMTGHIICAKLYKFLDTSQTKSTALREMIKSYKDSSRKQLEYGHDRSRQCRARSDRTEENRTETEEEKKQKRPTKHKYGEYKNVLLSDTEYKKLSDEWGISERDRMIKTLSEGIELKGYKYKSHYLALRKWKDNEKSGKKPDQYNMGTGRDIEGFC